MRVSRRPPQLKEKIGKKRLRHLGRRNGLKHDDSGALKAVRTALKSADSGGNGQNRLSDYVAHKREIPGLVTSLACGGEGEEIFS